MPALPNDILNGITTEPGVYLMKDEGGGILYIGKAKNLRLRLKHYYTPKQDGRLMVPFLTSQVTHIDTIITFSEKEALLLENTLIKQHQPKYNVLLKDDKTFISLTVNPEHTWPMIKLIRYRGRPKGPTLYFGPYPRAFAARKTLQLMSRIFQLRQCSDRELGSRTRPCLLYSIKRCLAPCTQKCTHQAYEKEVKRAIEFLKGNNRTVIQTLKKEMKQASDHLEFERASALLKTIKEVEQVIDSNSSSSDPSIVRTKGKDCDVFALHSEGNHHLIAQLIFRTGKLTGAESYPFYELASNEEEIWETFLLQHYPNKTHTPPEILLPLVLKEKKAIEEILSKKRKVRLHTPKKGGKLYLLHLAQKNASTLFKQEKDQVTAQEQRLLDLQETCMLTQLPLRIECFDASNSSGTDPVACMVGFKNGVRDKKQTRYFKINTVKKPDDYGALREVLSRHYTKAKKNDLLPDLALIDGGKGQLNCALQVFQELDIACVDLISLSKESGKHSKGLNREKIFIPHQKEPITLPPRSSTLFLLQTMRDEAHRVAITFHRKRRSKRIIKSALDHIPGIGPKKKVLLLKHFGSVKKIKEASREQLEKLKGLTRKEIDNLLIWQASQRSHAN